jgi:branched-chain amino acid transport system ATP-binding protein
MIGQSEAQPLLRVEDVGIHFGGLRALEGVGFSVGQGEIVGLIGPNGAGKTTLFNVITRTYRANAGSVRFKDIELLRKQTHEIARLGIARTFQNLGLVGSLDVRGNVLLGATARHAGGPVSTALGWRGRARRERAANERVDRILHDLELEDVADDLPGELPFGTLKRLELARAVASEPELLMLDEPANGLSAGEVVELSRLIVRLRAGYGLTILLVEHNMQMVMSISDRIVVLNFGHVLASGTPEQIRDDEAVVEAYLGATA